MSMHSYFRAAEKALAELRETQSNSIGLAAGLLADAIADGRSVYAFGASHSFIIAEEMVYRTGGMMLVNPIYPHGMNLMVRPVTATSKLERVVGLGREMLGSAPVQEGDCLIVASTSGRNAVAIDMAMEARARGLKVIGITSLAYTNAVASRHPSGKKLKDFCHVVIDNCAPYGDSAGEIEGFPQKVGPLSTFTGVAIVNALACEVVAKLVARGIEPPVFISANVDGGDEYNARLLKENSSRIHYLD